ncbi:MAG: nuclear transport factor 2 family protein [Thauera sp.]|jgi:steroid delta-isomerase|nr:nuclear transport factor 2 family protein [Thauera sp.]
MSSQAEMKATMLKYVASVNAGDLEAILALYADDATVEDPVGTPLVPGSKLRDFYQTAVASRCQLKVIAGPFGSFGNACAMAAEVHVPAMPGDAASGPKLISLIEVMTFNAAGKIESMRAYWGAEEMRPV